MKNGIEKNSTYYMYLDVLRIIACFLVIVNHTDSRVFLRTSPSETWFLGLTYFFICKAAVPLFLMISGVLLLRKIDSYKNIGKKILRFTIVLIVFSLLYYVDGCLTSNSPISIVSFFTSIYHNPATNALWYMYLYLAILIMLPILQKLANSMKKRDYQYYFFFSFIILGGMPIIVHYIPSAAYSDHFQLFIFSCYIGLLLLGFYIQNYLIINLKKCFIAIAIYIVGIAISVVLTYKEYLSSPKNYLFFDDRTLITVIAPSACLFIVVKYLFDKVHFGEKGKRIIKEIGGCTFGTYLFSDFFIHKLKAVGIEDSLFQTVNPFLAAVIMEIIVFSAGMAISFLFRRIPFIKKLL
ncbi:acyltransferase [Massilioclostridium coli]|uniref:acyltransferase n=1 Tax=Massilioclostridium coli TaxID=1870991 RepID=UPI00085BF396|nr:acyltransferase family protein [Massilioclostridium coli]